MTRVALWLVSFTASLSLVAGQSPQDQQKSKFWPWEVQVGASFMGYDSHNATGPLASTEFSAKNPRLAPSIRLSLDPISLPFGSILFSAGYRLGNDVPLERYGRSSRSDLSHDGQLQLGALLRFETSKNLEFGIGADYRSDSMKASQLSGTESKSSEMIPWARANARYMFNNWEHKLRWPFVGVEVAYALSGVDVNSSNYYRDYAINTGDYPLGEVGTTTSPNSFTRGNFPAWEVALVGGIRFGKHGSYTAPRPSAPKEVVTTPTPRPSAVTETRRPNVNRQAEEAARQAEEARRLAEEARRRDEEAARRAEEARRRDEEAKRRADEEAARQTAEARRRADLDAARARARAQVEAVILYFPTSGATETSQDRALIKTWVTQYKNVVDPSDLIITGHTDNQGAWDRNKELSVRRANTLANLLRAEGINVPAANITGESFDKPAADNATAEGRAKNRRVELRIRGANNNSVREGRLAGVR